MYTECKHLGLSREAVSIDAAGRETPILLHLCLWATTLHDVPTWANKQIGGGCPIDPETDCVNCSAFKAAFSIKRKSHQ